MKNFLLSDDFIESYKTKEVPWGYGELSYITYKRSYARKLPDGSTEDWYQTVRRVVEGTFSIQKKHCNAFNLEWDNRRAQKSAQIMYEKIFNFKMLPPGRGLWAMGTDIVDKIGSACLNNCFFLSTRSIDIDFADPFVHLMDFSMLGVGTGFDLAGAGKIKIKVKTGQISETFVVPDSREGWCEALRKTLDYYQGGKLYDFDYSEVRPAGSPIKTFGGIAPGSGPLKEMIESIRNILDPLIDSPITSVAITDIMDVIGKCVVSGNIRRTALIALGQPSDEEFIDMKNPTKYSKELQSHRWCSNNSIYAEVGQDYNEIAKLIALNGEPGVIWINNARSFARSKDIDTNDECIGVNPCSEIVLEDREMCNLVETFPANHDTPEEFLDTLKYAYMYCKTVTLIPTHNVKTNAVAMKNRRIGTSISGVQQAINKFGRRTFLDKFCDEGYTSLKHWDKIYSNWLGVPKSVRITTVKPSGTVSLLAGAFPGVHFPHSGRYIRNVRFSKNSPYIPALKKAGYLVEDDYYDKYSVVVAFPIEEHFYSKSKFDVSMIEQFKIVADMQKYWADNAVSCTITFSENEKPIIADALSMFETELKTASLLPLENHSYVQAPYIEVVGNDVQESKRYKDGYRIAWSEREFISYKKHVKPHILYSMSKDIDLPDGVGEKYCNNDTCELPTQKSS